METKMLLLLMLHFLLCVRMVCSQDLTLSVLSTTPTSVTILWTLGGNLTATSYTISFSNINTNCFSESHRGISTNETSYMLEGLEEGTEYAITLTASLINGETEMNSLTATTGTSAPSAGPSFVTITGVTPSTLSIKWGAVPCIHQNGIITGYSVKYWNSRDGKVTVFRADATEATISGLNMSTAYRIQVAAENRAGVGVYSEPAIEKSTLPGQPSVRVNIVTTSSISLSWSVPSDSVGTRYEVVWGEADGRNEMISTEVAGTACAIDSLKSSTIYRIKVRATNADGDDSTDSLIVFALTDVPGEDCDINNSIIALSVAFAVCVIAVAVTVIVLCFRCTTCGLLKPVFTKRPNTHEETFPAVRLPEPAYYTQLDVARNEAYIDVARNEAYIDVARNEAYMVGRHNVGAPPPLPPLRRDPETTLNQAYIAGLLPR